MSAISKGLLTPQEYLSQERKAQFKSEYYRGEAFAMAGATFEHTLIKDNLAGETRNHFKDGPCKVLTSDMRVKINPTGLYIYPDLVIVCDKPEFEDNQVDTLLNPRVVVEILSDSTEKYDRGSKFRNYRGISSLQEYVLVAQDRALIERYVRQADENWLLTTFEGLTAAFSLASISVRILLSEIYRGVTFPENAGR